MAGINIGRAPGARLTWREFSDAPGGGQRKELIDSRLYRTPHFTADQQAVIANLTAAFVAFRRSERKGDLVGAPFTLSFCQHDYVEPAFIWCERKWLRQIYNRGNVRGAPDVVVEFEATSASGAADYAGNVDSVYAREKRDLFERHGVREYWRIDIDTRTITIDRYDPIRQQFDEPPVVVRPGERLTTTELPVPEYWLLDPQDGSVTIYRRPTPDAGFNSPLTFTGSVQLTTPHLPGFEVALPKLFDLHLPSSTV